MFLIFDGTFALQLRRYVSFVYEVTLVRLQLFVVLTS